MHFVINPIGKKKKIFLQKRTSSRKQNILRTIVPIPYTCTCIHMYVDDTFVQIYQYFVSLSFSRSCIHAKLPVSLFEMQANMSQ